MATKEQKLGYVWHLLTAKSGSKSHFTVVVIVVVLVVVVVVVVVLVVL